MLNPSAYAIAEYRTNTAARYTPTCGAISLPATTASSPPDVKKSREFLTLVRIADAHRQHQQKISPERKPV